MSTGPARLVDYTNHSPPCKTCSAQCSNFANFTLMSYSINILQLLFKFVPSNQMGFADENKKRPKTKLPFFTKCGTKTAKIKHCAVCNVCSATPKDQQTIHAITFSFPQFIKRKDSSSPKLPKNQRRMETWVNRDDAFIGKTQPKFPLLHLSSLESEILSDKTLEVTHHD